MKVEINVRIHIEREQPKVDLGLLCGIDERELISHRERAMFAPPETIEVFDDRLFWRRTMTEQRARPIGNFAAPAPILIHLVLNDGGIVQAAIAANQGLAVGAVPGFVERAPPCRHRQASRRSLAGSDLRAIVGVHPDGEIGVDELDEA